ncbi:MAG: lamin tail domain-containing protein [Bacteroidota bacterium]|nr:lamin tail domain-containing protein [Bacteroidota bacterium]
MKKIVFLLLVLPFVLNAQSITENFSDGDFTNNPTWTGAINDFQINSNFQLQLNAAAAGASYLSTTSPVASIDNMEWQFYIRLDFSPSVNNLSKIYLASNNTDLSGSLNGYYLKIGENGSLDAVELYRQTGTTSTLVCRGSNSLVANAFAIRVKVTRDNSGLWRLFADPNAGYNFIPEATGTDNTYNSSASFGVSCLYTVSNITKFYFDDFFVGPIIIDTTPPVVQNVKVVSNTELEVEFNEGVLAPEAENVLNYVANNSIGNPINAVRNNLNPSLVHLTFANIFPDGTVNSLTVSNVKDFAENVMATSSHSFFHYTVKPYDVVFNEIMVDPSPTVGLPDYEYIELYNTTSLPINVKNWTFSHGTTNRILPDVVIPADSFLVLCAPAAFADLQQFGNVISVTSLSTSALTNAGTTISLKNENGGLIHALQYSDSWYQDNTKADGGWSLEQIDPHNPCGGKTNWKASNHVLGGTPGEKNSINGINPDNEGPKVISTCVISENLLEVVFNEPVQGAAVNDISSYLINNSIGTPISVTSQGILVSSVVLSLTNSLVTETIYTLTVNGNISDCAGNAMITQSTQFAIHPAKPFDIVINEIMAKPDPIVNLPNSEYIELYNRTDFPVNLNGWTISVGNNIKSFPCISIMPKGYLIVCNANSVDLFSTYGSVTGIVSLPSLANSGATVTIRNIAGKVINTVSYSDSWYKDNNKKNGGWSLEQIDPLNPCEGINNWKASLNLLGGTPGKINSVHSSNMDTKGPQLLRVAIIDSMTIRLYFNESLHPESILDPLTYSIDNAMGNPLFVQAIEPEFTSVILKLSAVIQNGITYTVTAKQDLKDCAGNMLNVNESTARFAIAETIEPFDIVINEILFNPKDNGVDFVEIYNRSSKIIDLKQVRLSSIDAALDELSSIKDIDTVGYILFPGDYLVLCTNTKIVQEHYNVDNPKAFLKMSSLPTYSNSSGKAALSKKDNSIVDRFDYTDQMHFPLLNNLKGVSLERIDPDRPTNDNSNWHSAAESVGFATPGYKNSQYKLAKPTDDPISVEPKIFSPDNDGFNDVVNINYKLDAPGYVGNITIFDAQGRIIKYLMKSELLATEGTVSWDGINETREKASIGIYIIFFEMFDLSGNVKKYKKTCVLGGNL